MRRRLASFFALLLCITYSITFGAISANATYNTLDDLPIDPMGDLEQFKENSPNFSGGLIPALPEREPELVEPNLGDTFASDGPMLFSMNDNDTLRTFTVRAGLIEFGHSNYTVKFDSSFNPISFSSRNGTNAVYVLSGISAANRVIGRVNKDTVIDIEVPFEASAGQVVRVVGSGSFGLAASASSVGGFMYPDAMSVIVNGEAVSPAKTIGSLGLFAFSEDFEFELDTEVHSIGYRFSYYSTKSGDVQTGTSVSDTIALLCSFNDQITWEFLPAEPEYSGLLSSILGWLSNLWDAIISLPGNIANLILDGLSALFLPSEEDILVLQENYSFLFSERLGFIWQGFDWLLNFFSSFVDVLSSSSDYEFEFPGISVPMNGETVVIVEPASVSLNNDVMNVLRPVCGTIVSLIAVIGATNVLFNLAAALISGVSYFEFLKRGRDDDVS